MTLGRKLSSLTGFQMVAEVQQCRC